jgi:hypothetical protein
MVVKFGTWTTWPHAVASAIKARRQPIRQVSHGSVGVAMSGADLWTRTTGGINEKIAQG